MKPFRQYIQEDDSWWDEQTPEFQEKYIKDHPNSKFAKNAKAAQKDEFWNKRANGPKTLGQSLADIMTHVSSKKKDADPRKPDIEEQENFHNLFKKYVPQEGTADTLLGEMIRAASRIQYRLWNDGDMYGWGYGKETVNNAFSFLSKMVASADTPLKKEVNDAMLKATQASEYNDEEEYTRQINRMINAFATADWNDLKQLANVKNEKDSLEEYPDDTSYDYDDDEDEDW